MIFLWIYGAWVVGMFMGAFWNTEETCPRAVLGFNCRGGDDCDHRKSLLYENMAAMAKNAEQRELEKERNLWKGDNDAEN